MGKTLTFEVGKANIGRRVRFKVGDGGPNMCFGTLTGADERHADIKPDNYSGPPKQIPWAHVRDWTSRNPGPLRPPTVEAKPLIAAKIAPSAPAAQPRVVAPPAVVDPFSEFGALSSQLTPAMDEITAAEDEIDDATEMVEQARARHAEAIRKLADLRKKIATATALIDQHLIGTSYAPKA